MDIGSATVKVAGVDGAGDILGTPVYVRHDQYASQLEAARAALTRYLGQFDRARVVGSGVTGSGRELFAHLLGGALARTEIFAHATGVGYILRRGMVRDRSGEVLSRAGTVIEIGGQDAKVIVFDDEGMPVYFNMNSICAAGTGEFLVQLAQECQISVEDIGPLVAQSSSPAYVDATCTVFARRAFRHLTQRGVPLEDRLAGVCDALVKNYVQNVLRGHPVVPPVIFQGGVAANEGVRQAFERALGMPVFAPPFHSVLGAIGMAVIARDTGTGLGDTAGSGWPEDFLRGSVSSRIRYCRGCQNSCEVTEAVSGAGDDLRVIDVFGGRCEGAKKPGHLSDEPPARQMPYVVVRPKTPVPPARSRPRRLARSEYFAGIDCGSRGTKYALIQSTGHGYEVVAVGTVPTAGNALDAIGAAAAGLQQALPERARWGAIGVTGSAGELAYHMLSRPAPENADCFVSEIIAHYRFARDIVPDVGTVIDIGGNDSKIITTGGHGISFAMNDKCAAGSGAFLEAVAARFHVDIEDYGRVAMQSRVPARIAGRCAVFGETDVVHKARQGFPVPDLLLGVAYAVCRTYLTDTAKGQNIRLPVVAQGGAFLNTALQEAFRTALGLGPDEFFVADDPRLVVGAGALGAALVARERWETGWSSRFWGFDHAARAHFETRTLVCRHPRCGRQCPGVIALLSDGEPVAGYKSVDCPLGFFDGVITSSEEASHVASLLGQTAYKRA